MAPLIEPTDQQLTGRLQGGDLVALDEIYTRHHARIFGYLSRWLDDANTAEDLVQETFLRVLRQRARIPAHEDLLPWLLRLAHNLVIDRYRHERIRFMVDDVAMLADPGPIPLDRLTSEEREHQLTSKQRTLPA